MVNVSCELHHDKYNLRILKNTTMCDTGAIWREGIFAGWLNNVIICVKFICTSLGGELWWGGRRRWESAPDNTVYASTDQAGWCYTREKVSHLLSHNHNWSSVNECCDLSRFTELHVLMSKIINKSQFWPPNNYSCPLTVISDFYMSEEDELIPLNEFH